MIEFKGKLLSDFHDVYSNEYDRFKKYGRLKQSTYNIQGEINFDDILWWLLIFIAPKTYDYREYELIQLFYNLKESLANKNLQIKTKKGSVSNILNITSNNIIVELLLSVNNSLINFMNYPENQVGYKISGKPNHFDKSYITESELLELHSDIESRLIKEATSKFYTLCTNDEIDIIKSKLDFYNDNKYQGTKKLIKILLSKFKEHGVFSSKLKTISTNEACFIYDMLGFVDIVPNVDILCSQEKYQFVKSKMS